MSFIFKTHGIIGVGDGIDAVIGVGDGIDGIIGVVDGIDVISGVVAECMALLVLLIE